MSKEHQNYYATRGHSSQLLILHARNDVQMLFYIIYILFYLFSTYIFSNFNFCYSLAQYL